MSASTSPTVLPVSLLARAALRDREGARLGRVDDLIVRLDEPGHPRITGLLVYVAGRHSFLGVEQVEGMSPGRVLLHKARLDLGRFTRHPEEVLLRKDVLDRQLINVEGARLVRANDILLGGGGSQWRVVGVETGLRGALRRLMPRRLAERVAVGEALDWACVEPFVGHVPTVRLRVPHPGLARLHPAQLADLIEAASHREGEEIIEAVGRDRELEADVFEELDDQHQREFLEERPDAQAAEVLTRMSSDDAADLIGELDDERQEALLALLPPAHQRKLRALLGYDPATAGGLMSPDFVCLGQDTTVSAALDAVRGARAPREALSVVYVSAESGRLTGAVALVELVRADGEAALSDVVEGEPTVLSAADELEEIARVMADYNLVCAPVIDDDRRVLGVVTVDDLLEVLVPSTWRRRFGVLGAP